VDNFIHASFECPSRSLAFCDRHGDCSRPANNRNSVQVTALKSEDEIEKRIRAYLSGHPEAHDTLEGIVEWWLLEQQIRQTSSAVEVALRGLVTKHVVEEFCARDGRVHYRLVKPGCRRNTGRSEDA